MLPIAEGSGDRQLDGGWVAYHQLKIRIGGNRYGIQPGTAVVATGERHRKSCEQKSTEAEAIEHLHLLAFFQRLRLRKNAAKSDIFFHTRLYTLRFPCRMVRKTSLVTRYQNSQ
jgi:hypothetical protein